MKYNKKELIKVCNKALQTNADINTISARLTDVEQQKLPSNKCHKIDHGIMMELHE